MLFDCHNHSQFSFDGMDTSVEAAVRKAISEGLAGMCFTDHCDPWVPQSKGEFEKPVSEVFDIAAQQAEADRIQAILKAEGLNFRIFKGIEAGVSAEGREQLKQILSENRFDQVNASVHYLCDCDPYYGEYYGSRNWKEAYGLYLETLFEEVKQLGKAVDVLGHFDYIVRYAPYPQVCITYRDFADLWDSILSYLAYEGKALEINTKTYQSYNGRTPELDSNILLRYRELGGELITLGSDSHAPTHVGFNFQATAAKLQALGFSYLAHFENRKPVMEKSL